MRVVGLVWLMACPVVSSATEPLTDVVTMAIGETMCAVRADGTVWCWGTGWHGAAERERHDMAVQVAGLSDIGSIDAGRRGMCAVDGRGRVFCWGSVGERPQLSRVRLGATERVGVGSAHACALARDGAVRCWGDNSHGQLSLDAAVTEPALRPVLIEGLPEAIDLAVGGNQSCILDAQRRVHCWGAGEGLRTSPEELGPAYALAVDQGLVCVIDRADDLLCWMGDDRMQGPIERLTEGVIEVSAAYVDGLGEPKGTQWHRICTLTADLQMRCRFRSHPKGRVIPQSSEGTAEAYQAAGLATGGAQGCMIDVDGMVHCWGGTDHRGMLGQGGDLEFEPPELYFENAHDMVVGHDSVCVAGEGPVRCRGFSRYPTKARVNVEGLADMATLAWMGPHLCGQRMDGEFVCSPGFANVPELTAPLQPVRIVSGDRLGCAIDARSEVTCSGMVGYFWGTASPPPLRLPRVRDLSVGEQWGCYIDQRGAASCFGSRFRGLERGAPGVAALRALAVEGEPVDGGVDMPRADKVVVGTRAVCTETAGTFSCGTMNSEFSALRDIRRVRLFASESVSADVGGKHSLCAVSQDHELRCVVLSKQGDELLAAYPVTGMQSAVQVDLDEGQGCVRDAEGDVYCWRRDLRVHLGGGFHGDTVLVGESR